MRRHVSTAISAALHLAVAGALFLIAAPMSEPVEPAAVAIRATLKPVESESAVEFRPEIRRPVRIPRGEESAVRIDPAPVVPDPEPPAPIHRPVVIPMPKVRVGVERLPTPPATATVSDPALKGETVSAVLLADPSPEYPEGARRRRQEGEVVVDVEIAPDGAIRDVTVKESSGVDALDRAAMKAAWSARYRPALVAGEAVAARDRIRFVFRLE